MQRTSDPSLVRGRWKKYGLPEDMSGKSFLDVGCWAGGYVKEAESRGADYALGIDAVESIMTETEASKFIQMDVFSPNFLALPLFDVVFCGGVLYHVSDPVGLLRRLKLKTGQFCILETAVMTVASKIVNKTPFLQYCPQSSFDNNPSNWFIPNMEFLRAIMEEVGFDILRTQVEGDRACLHLKPFRKLSDKILPRKVEYMKN